MTPARRTQPAHVGVGLLALAFALLMAACGVAAAPSPSPTILLPTPTPVPGASGGSAGGGTGGATGGGTNGSGNTGSGVIVAPPGNGGPLGDPNLGQAQLVVPQPGQLDLHPASVVLIRTAVDGRHVSVELRWWSGIAPCTVLDSVTVARTGSTFMLTPLEGSTGQLVACEDIAQLKATIVDLGDLEPGTYTIQASGNPPSVDVVVS